MYFKPGLDNEITITRITSLSADQIQNIRIHRPLRNDLVLVKDNQHNWQLEYSPALPADQLQVNVLTGLAEQIAIRSYPASQLDLDKLQLDPAYATITLNQTTISFGNIDAIEDLRYTQVGDQVHLISDQYQPMIEARPTQLVRRALFSEHSKIREIRLPNLSLLKKDEQWVTEPEQPASAAEIQQFINAWQLATAQHIRADDQTASDVDIEIILDNPAQKVQLKIIARTPKLILLRPDYGIQYRMGDRAADLLALPKPKIQ